MLVAGVRATSNTDLEIILGQDHGKLLAADSGSEIYAARSGLQRFCQPTDRLIAGLMPVSIIDLLEMIYIEQEQAERSLITLRARDLALQLALEAATIGEARQMIRKSRLLVSIQIPLKSRSVRTRASSRSISSGSVSNRARRPLRRAGILRLTCARQSV